MIFLLAISAQTISFDVFDVNNVPQNLIDAGERYYYGAQRRNTLGVPTRGLNGQRNVSGHGVYNPTVNGENLDDVVVYRVGIEAEISTVLEIGRVDETSAFLRSTWATQQIQADECYLTGSAAATGCDTSAGAASNVSEAGWASNSSSLGAFLNGKGG